MYFSCATASTAFCSGKVKYLEISINRMFRLLTAGYEKLFNRIPNHIVTIKHQRNIRGLTVEECARRCLQELRFNCRGFDYETRRRNCYLTDRGMQDTDGLQKRPHTDFYERKSSKVFLTDNFVDFSDRSIFLCFYFISFYFIFL